MNQPTVHNPSNFNPADYVVVDYVDNRRPVPYGWTPAEFADHQNEVAQWEAHNARLFGADWRAKINRCVHCGNGNVRWITAVQHVPTGETVTFGADCTERLGFKDQHTFKLALLKSRDEARKVRIAIYSKREAFLAANPAIVDVLARINNPEHAKNFFAKDVLAKLDRYGDLSPRQVETVLASLQRDVEFAARKAVEATEAKGPAPSGRVEVSGVVLSTKWVSSGYASYRGAEQETRKALVKLANNSKVWVTANDEAIEKGASVTFKATFTVSNDDTHFAFGKRPTFLSVTPAASEQAAA